MKNIRVWFTKDNECKYISHLDLNRVMSRALHKSGINIWHTEGFNPHPFLTFALPLSLGFKGIKENMDIRLLDDSYDKQEIINALNSCLPTGIRVFDVTDPVMKPGDIAQGIFEVSLFDDNVKADVIKKQFQDLMSQDEIPVMKKTKKGIKQIDIKPLVINFEVENREVFTFKITLPAGSSVNINPNLFINAYNEKYKTDIFYSITRLDILDKDGNSFR